MFQARRLWQDYTSRASSFADASQEHIPPSRGLEIRTLEVVQEQELGNPFSTGQFHNHNIAPLQRSGGITIHVQLYKTLCFKRHNQIELQVSQVILGLDNSRCQDTAYLEIRIRSHHYHNYCRGMKKVL